MGVKWGQFGGTEFLPFIRNPAESAKNTSHWREELFQEKRFLPT